MALSLYDLNNNKATRAVATSISDGLMSATDKAKLNSIAANANNYVLPVASTILGGIKSGTDITVDANGNVTVNNADTVDGLHASDFIQKDEKITLPASTANTAYLNITNGLTPSAPINGDIWQQNNNFYTRLNNATKTIWHSGNAIYAASTPVTQATAEAGTSISVYHWTPLRVHQAIDANLINSAKLLANASGIKGTGTGTSNLSYFEFNENDGTTRQGYVGYVSNSNETLYLTNNTATGGITLLANNSSGQDINLLPSGKATVNGNEILTANAGCIKYYMSGRQRTQRLFSVPKTQTCEFNFEITGDGTRQGAQSILAIHFGVHGGGTTYITQAYRTGAKPAYTLHFVVYDEGTNLSGYIVSDIYVDEWTIIEKHKYNINIEIVNVGANTYVPSGTKVFDSDTDSVQILNTQILPNTKVNLYNASGIKGNGTGTGNVSYFSFFENNGTTRQGYIGFGTSANTEFQFFNDVAGGDIGLRTTGAGKVTVNGNEILTAQTRTATIPTTGWSASTPYTRTITVSGLTSTMKPFISPVYSTTNATAILQKTAWNMIGKITTGTNSITVTCFEEKPTTAIPIQIMGG